MMQKSLPIQFFACSWEDAQSEVRQQRHCDWWVFDWPGVDYYWLYGNNFSWIQPLPVHSPLARRYFDQISNDINTAISQSVSSCESRHYATQASAKTGLQLTVSSRLEQG